MRQLRRIAVALICFVLLFSCCLETVAETGRMSTEASFASGKTKLKISGSEVVAKGKKITLKANMKVTWKTSNKKIATVNEKGEVKGIKAGKVKITAVSKTKPKVRQTWKITVTPKAVKKIKITAPVKKLDLEDKKTVQLTAVVSPAAADQQVKWSSSDKTIAKVNSKGKVTALKEGKVRITAKSTDGSGKKASIQITIRNRTPEEKEKEEILRIDDGVTRIQDGAYEGNKILKEADLPETLTAIGHRAFANSSIQYIYIPAGVKTIEEDAFAGCGSLVCLAPAGSYAAEWCAAHGITRQDPVYMIGLKPSKTAAVKNGGKKKIISGVQPAVSRAKLNWVSSDEKIFTVNGNGTVSGNYPGKAILTVSSQNGSFSARIEVTVQANYRAVLFSESTFVGGIIQRNRGDVRLMKSMLSSVTGPDGGKYKVSSFDDLTASQVYDKIDKLLVTPSREGDVSLFFFASHGDDRSTTEQYAGRLWCKYKKTWLELPALAKKLSGIKGKVIVLLESCGPGAALHHFDHGEDALAEEQEDATGFSREIISAFSSADPGLSVYQPKEADIQGKADSGKTGGKDSAKSSQKKAKGSSFQTSKFIVMTAAAYRQMSYMYGGDNQNLFPYWLTRGVGTGGIMPADKECGNGDGKLTVNELYKYVYKKTVYKQTPQVYPKNSDYVLFMRR